MKKFFFIALMAVGLASSAFAGTSSVNISVLNNFKSSFGNANDISWTLKDDFAKATFTLNNVKMEAFFNSAGELIGTSKNISMDEVPVSAKRTFAKKFGGYTVTEAIHFEGADENAYYISADNNSESVIIKLAENGQVTTFKKTIK